MLRHFGIALASLMVLTGCAGTGGGFALPKPAPEQIRVANKEVLIAGPKGFCIDPTETQDADGSAFVLLGSCAAIANSRSKPHPKVPAILTATVSQKSTNPPITGSMPALAEFFRSKAGRAALSRDGNADTVEVVKTLDRDGVFYIRARDSSSDILAGAANEYWRALFDVNGRIVSASVFGLREHPIASEKGFEVLRGFTNRIRAGNTAGPDKVVTENKPRIPFFKRVFKRKPE
ncbi:hypothetical protein [Profundibacter amoris]|uniref:Dihydroxy-acid dehydratase n=1 Tax=Profundibacter amoris TaxID=2171755 RepID=A0A347UKP5_9RHOB|nr:hypothetical protein [Profundibacter amoris]AXX99423.1 hypothetical protein BAR1_16675 [Profundibacter amoris]